MYVLLWPICSFCHLPCMSVLKEVKKIAEQKIYTVFENGRMCTHGFEVYQNKKCRAFEHRIIEIHRF